jgi:putative DNA primase/helicase
MTVTVKSANVSALEWPEPQPLTPRVESRSFPLDALPKHIRAAVEEVHAFEQAPIPLIVSSALGAVSLAAQAHFNVERAEGLSGPVGVYLLVVADSGERKSTCDKMFTSALLDYEHAQAKAAEPAKQQYATDLAMHEAIRQGIVDGIRIAVKKNATTGDLEQKLRAHDKVGPPKEPRVPRLIYSDVTPEALAFSLAKTWPSGGIMSSEGACVFGSHGMSQDSVMRNLGLLNQGWDGADLTVDRRTSESYRVREPRLTIALQVQEATLRAFLKQSGELARGSGFLARFLIAWPESTQGTRLYTEPPVAWPCLDAFNKRIRGILERDVKMDADGVLTPATLTLSAPAKVDWVAFHDRVERELGEGGRYRDLRDVASKIADNACRLAALFHVFERAKGTEISVLHFKEAARVAEWYLGESRRFFGELALPAGVADAEQLETWIVARCKKENVDRVPVVDIQKFGPNKLRHKQAFYTAVTHLQDLGRVQQLAVGNRKYIGVNPAVLTATCATRPAKKISAATKTAANRSRTAKKKLPPKKR